MKSLILIALLLFTPPLVLAKKYQPPKIEVETAISMAKKHLKGQGVSLEKNFIIQKVVFLNMYSEWESAHWVVRWEKTPKEKGKWLEVKIYNDGVVKFVYGE